MGQNSKKYAQIQVNRIRERTQQLRRHPNSGREVPELDNPRIRELILGNYRIIYCLVSDERVDILNSPSFSSTTRLIKQPHNSC
ncbi:MAG: type II toxin-antitoxin system RelE/ParE family toxin [Bacteroidota bacterium]